MPNSTRGATIGVSLPTDFCPFGLTSGCAVNCPLSRNVQLKANCYTVNAAKIALKVTKS